MAAKKKGGAVPPVPPAWWFDEPEQPWAGDESLPDSGEERLEELYEAFRQRREDAE